MGKLHKAGGKKICRSFFRRKTNDNQFSNRRNANNGDFSWLFCVGRGAAFRARTEAPDCDNNFNDGLCVVASLTFVRLDFPFCILNGIVNYILIHLL